MQVKVRNFSNPYALFATLSDPMELVQLLRVFTVEKPPRLKDSLTRKLILLSNVLIMIYFDNSGALSGKGGKWNDKTLDKWLKSPADYAPGKYFKTV